MKIIGITGGVGAGKSQILSYLKLRYSAFILQADQVAHQVKEPGETAYDSLVKLLGVNVLNEKGEIDREKMATMIFSDHNLLCKVNQIIHPAVKDMVIEAIKIEKLKGCKLFIIEAALLIEDHYENIVDEMWYVYTSAEIRKTRLVTSRHYPLEKIEAIESKQLSEEDFRRHCSFVINNNGTIEETYAQIDKKMEEFQ